MFSRSSTLLFAAALLLTAAGCTHVSPWQRQKLAHPTMTADMNGPGMEHVHAVHEGAAGGSGGAEGGCGCN